MNQRLVVIAVAVVAIALFVIASLVYVNRRGEEPPIRLDPPAAALLEQDGDPATAESAAPATEAPAVASAADTTAQQWTVYVRRHSPVIGPANARVTIVEFFDPACEACRAFYPIVHEILQRHPNDVRLVLRYTPLHEGSDEAVRILETARMQNKFEPVLSSLFQHQPQWADHNTPRINLAWDAAGAAGLNVDSARSAMNDPRIDAALRQDLADAGALRVRGTPTFFVNERPLTNFGPQQLYDLVLAELEATQ